MSPRKRVEYEVSDDDLDELSSLADEDVKPNIGPLAGSLSKPRHVTLSCKQLHDLIHFGSVDLNPEYQRDVVWPETKMIGLIQSLFLNYYVPPIIFAVATDPHDGSERRVTIDGKQRCTSIMRFMDGEIPFVSPATKERFYYRSTHSRGKVLPANLKSRFDMINVVAVEYDNISDETQRDVFQRVQLGVALSASEKLQAIPGPWTTWISELLKKYVLEEGTLSDAISWDTKRGKPFQVIAAIIMLCYDPSRTSPPTSSEMKKWLERSDGPDAGFRRKIEKTMSLLVAIPIDFYGVAFDTVKAAKVAPVELWFTGVLIYTRMGTTPVAALAQQIGEMRAYVRTRHKDIFSNTTVVRSFVDFLDKLPPYKLGRNEVVAAVEWEGEDPETATVIAEKRKREAAEEAADPDYRGAPVARRDKSDVVQNTRSKASTATSSRRTPSTSNSQPPRSHVAVTSATRPPPSAMDAPPTPATGLSANFGHVKTNNPYDPPFNAAAAFATNNQQRYQVDHQRYAKPSTSANPNPDQPYGQAAQTAFLQQHHQQRTAMAQHQQENAAFQAKYR